MPCRTTLSPFVLKSRPNGSRGTVAGIPLLLEVLAHPSEVRVARRLAIDLHAAVEALDFRDLAGHAELGHVAAGEGGGDVDTRPSPVTMFG